MYKLLLLVGTGSSIISLASGLILYSNSSFIKTDAFSLVCDVQGTITSSVTFSDASGGVPGFCFAPPSNCISADGNILERDETKGTVVLTVVPKNVHIPASEGNWSCTDGSVANYFSVEIYSVTHAKLITQSTNPGAGDQVNVQIDCLYPYPDEIKIDYVKESDHGFVKSVDVQFDNGTSTNCPVADSRAISMNGTFVLDDKDLFEEARIEVTVLLNGNKLTTTLSSFTIKPVTGCKYSDVELIFGGVSCFLIVLITSIIMLIIQGCKILLEIFGEIKPIKVIISIVFDLVALIIGLALGFGLKECDQRDLGLGLGLGFGFIFAIALVLTLYIYHKQCGSKKGYEI